MRSAWLLGVQLAIIGAAAPAGAAPALALAENALAPAGQLGTPTTQGDRAAPGDLAVLPPRPIRTEVPTPEAPQKQVVVVLELLIDDRGNVEAASLIDGREPFASAALEAAAHFTFTPAEVRGRPSAAKIRFLVRFEPEMPLPVEPSAAPPPVTRDVQRGQKSEPGGSPPLEVVVSATRPAYTTGVITRAEAREIPGTFGDPLRAIETSAGVTPVYSGVPFFFVRGAPPGNVGFFLDGVRVPLLYHAVLGPSVIHPALIDHVDLYRGTAPVKFGRYAGAIVNAETRAPLGRAGGEANVRLFDAGGLVESPFAGGRGHALVGGRYSYTGLIVSLLTKAKLSYWDYQSRIDYETSRHGRIGLFVFGAYDSFTAPDGTVERGGGTQFHRLDLRYDYDNDHTKSRVALMTGYDRTGSPSGALNDQLVGIRSLTEHRILRELTVTYGSDMTIDRYRLRIDQTTAEATDLSALFPNRTDVVGAVFAGADISPTKWLALSPGIRADAYRVAGATATSIDPRFAATLRPHRRIYTSYSVGVINQPPNYVPQVPAASVGTLQGGLQRALSMNTTIGATLPYDFALAVTGYRAEYYNLLDPIGSDRYFQFDRNVLTQRERGMAYGIELELRRPMTRRIGGFLSATLSHSERSSGASETLSAFDRPLVVSAALGVDLGYRIRAGTRLAYYSGIPGRVFQDQGTRFDGGHRSAPYFRADLRLERRWPIAGRGYWAIVFEMLNATLSKEVTARNCGTLGCTDTTSGPISIPSIGFEIYSY